MHVSVHVAPLIPESRPLHPPQGKHSSIKKGQTDTHTYIKASYPITILYKHTVICIELN